MANRIFFLGIGGTLMGSLAVLAKQSGFDVSGCDGTIYPPMSDQLKLAEIKVYEGFDESMLSPKPDVVVVGNANQPRGTPAIEYILNERLNYTSAAAWLGDVVMHDRHVIAVSGTHGKTTTSSMVSWILEYAGLAPGFLIGGVPCNFDTPARLGQEPYFVVEADEYDTSYFDRRSKFIHYRPRSLIINNIEFDHADIFPDLEAIKFQFHHLVRAVPGNGRIIAPVIDSAVKDVLSRGCWSPLTYFYADPNDQTLAQLKTHDDVWYSNSLDDAGTAFEVFQNGVNLGTVNWSMQGSHNASNALAAIVAATDIGVTPQVACEALNQFVGVKRRMEIVFDNGMLTVYDDFAHHPTAIRTTLDGLRKQVGTAEIVAVIDPRTHTMSLGTLQDDLKTCARDADQILWFKGEQIKWDIESVAAAYSVSSTITNNLDLLVDEICAKTSHRRHVVIMSNGSFGGIYDRIRSRLAESKPI